MATLLLILGDLAAGKSTLARRISKNTDTLCLVKDTMKEILADDIGFTTRPENKKLSVASVSMMKYVFSQYAPLKKSLILEANFHQDEIECFKKMADKEGFQFLCFYLEGDVDELYKRFLHRIKFEHRHRAHMTADIMEHDGFAAYLEKSRKEVKCAEEKLAANGVVAIASNNMFTTLRACGDNFDEVYEKAMAHLKDSGF